jgi:hypothetical protein
LTTSGSAQTGLGDSFGVEVLRQHSSVAHASGNRLAAYGGVAPRCPVYDLYAELSRLRLKDREELLACALDGDTAVPKFDCFRVRREFSGTIIHEQLR